MKMKDLTLAQVRRGERFTLDGVEFVKLEDDLDAAFAVAADTLPECCQFEDDDAEREDHNNYAGSLLSKTVERWLRDKHPAIFSAVVERPIDLTTMDGMTDYGKPLAVVRALTIDEYRKHRSILPLTSKPYWLATAWTTNSSPYSNDSSAYRISTGGTVVSDYVYNAYFAPRPALYKKARFNESKHVWTFPSGAKIFFGSMQYTKDRTNYQGKRYDFIDFDELTQFLWEEYSYLFSRNRPNGPGTRCYRETILRHQLTSGRGAKGPVAVCPTCGGTEITYDRVMDSNLCPACGWTDLPDFPKAFPEDGDKPLLVEAPYDGLYDLYLMSKVDFYNREADNYNNSALAYNAALDEWRKQYHRRHLPIGGGGLTGLF